MDLWDDLNPAQREAVLFTEGPLLVLSGVGSGKTRVITYRIAYLIEQGIARPWNILAMTFTNKAADEMKNRVRSLLGGGEVEVLVGTFHSVCVRILRGHAHRLGFGNDFAIYDEKDQSSMIGDCLEELGLDSAHLSPRLVQYHLGRCKENLLSLEEFLRKGRGDRLERRLGAVFELYQRRMRESNALDFDDLLVLTVELFDRFPEVLEYYRNRWRYVLVDEFQDTNHAQYEMVRRLCQGHRNLCIVGDDDQSIYSWRGANPVNLHCFERDFPEARVIKLEQNYRSTKRILEASGGVIRNNVSRKAKQLWTENPSGEPVTHYAASDERDEARFVLDEVQRGIREEGWALGDVAIFYRTHAQSRVFEEELRKRGIPYGIYGGVGYYERKEVRDILAYLRAISNPKDSLSWKRILNTPRRGIGKTTIERIEGISFQRGIPFRDALWQWVKDPAGPRGSRKRVQAFLEQMQAFQDRKDRGSLLDLTHSILQDTGYLASLSALEKEESRQRWQNVEEFFHLIEEFESQKGRAGLFEFLQEISLASDMDRLDGSEDRLSLMTLHSAKGLEFTVVFIVGMEDGLIPHQQCLAKEADLEEERRLCYVGMTRAKRRLYLTHARKRWHFGKDQENPTSRFFREIPSEALMEIGFSASEEEDEKGPFYPGQWIRHLHFGVGRIRTVWGDGEERKAAVHFPGTGERILLLHQAPITRVT